MCSRITASLKACCIAFLIDASSSEPSRKPLHSQLARCTDKLQKKCAYVSKSEFPCINIGPRKVGKSPEPARCNASLRYKPTVTYMFPRLYVLSNDKTLPLILSKQKDYISHLSVRVQYYLYYSSIGDCYATYKVICRDH